MTRQDVLDLMAYDLHFGLPDDTSRERRKLPKAPAKRSAKKKYRSSEAQQAILRTLVK